MADEPQNPDTAATACSSRCYAFVKYSHRWAYGQGEWDYMFTDSESLLNDDELRMTLESEHANDWSGHYRGVVFEVVDAPSEEWLQKEIEINEQRIAGMQEYVARLRQYA